MVHLNLILILSRTFWIDVISALLVLFALLLFSNLFTGTIIIFLHQQAQVEDGPDDDGNMFTRPGKVRKKTPECDTLGTVSPLNVEKITAVKDAAYAVAKRELEKI